MSETEAVTQEEISAKKAEKRSLEKKKNESKSRMDDLDDQIDDLNRAIREMERLETDFTAEKDKLEKDIHGTKKFKGANHNRLIDQSGEKLITEMQAAKRSINKAADDLIDLRTKIQNEKSKEYGIFSGLLKAYYKVQGWLEKFGN
ncbi:MAG: hypothetical protein IKS31_08905 [Clostridia bacterium]|nr:hypothetical protein [Clostridia bacterium]